MNINKTKSNQLKSLCLIAILFASGIFVNNADARITKDNFISTIQAELKSRNGIDIMYQLLTGNLTTLNFANNPKLMNDLSDFITNSINECIKKFPDESIANITENIRRELINKINHSLFIKNTEYDDWTVMRSPRDPNIVVIMPIYNLNKQGNYKTFMTITCWYNTKNKTTILKGIAVGRQLDKQTQ